VVLPYRNIEHIAEVFLNISGGFIPKLHLGKEKANFYALTLRLFSIDFAI